MFPTWNRSVNLNLNLSNLVMNWLSLNVNLCTFNFNLLNFMMILFTLNLNLPNISLHFYHSSASLCSLNLNFTFSTCIYLKQPRPFLYHSPVHPPLHHGSGPQRTSTSSTVEVRGKCRLWMELSLSGRLWLIPSLCLRVMSLLSRYILCISYLKFLSYWVCLILHIDKGLYLWWSRCLYFYLLWLLQVEEVCYSDIQFDGFFQELYRMGISCVEIRTTTQEARPGGMCRVLL